MNVSNHLSASGRAASTSAQRVFGSLGRLGLGAAPIGNLYSEVREADARETLLEAIRIGIRYIDTAPYYGHGLSEERVGRALREVPRSEIVISTKVGRLIEQDSSRREHLNDGFAIHGSRARFDYSRDGVRRSLDASLRRLAVDRIDVLLLHDVGHETHGERHPQILRQALNEALPAMAELREAGIVGAIGIGVNEVAVCREIIPRFPLDCIMLAGRYTLFEQADALPLLDEAWERSVRVIIAGPYSTGLLSDSQAPGSTYNYRPVSQAVLERARKIYTFCAAHGVEVGAAALQFPLAHRAVASIVAGLRSVKEVATAGARMEAAIPPVVWKELRAAGVLTPEAPVPT
jgi:D-threo-aldose 1-dehydrogenase